MANLPNFSVKFLKCIHHSLSPETAPFFLKKKKQGGGGGEDKLGMKISTNFCVCSVDRLLGINYALYFIIIIII